MPSALAADDDDCIILDTDKPGTFQPSSCLDCEGFRFVPLLGSDFTKAEHKAVRCAL